MIENEMRVQDLLIKYQSVVRSKDVEGFKSLYHEDIIVYDMWNVWEYKGLEAWGGMAEEWFSSLGEETVDVQFADTVVQASDDFATLFTMVKYIGLSAEGEELRSLNNRMTWVLRKFEDQWLVIHEHSSSPGTIEDGKLMLESDYFK